MINAIIKDLYPCSYGFWLVLMTLIIWSLAIHQMMIKKNMDIALGLIGTVWSIALLRSSVNLLSDLYMLGTSKNGISNTYYHLRFAFSLCNPIFQCVLLSILFMILAVLTRKNIKTISVECIWGIIAGLGAVLVGFFILIVIICDNTYIKTYIYMLNQ